MKIKIIDSLRNYINKRLHPIPGGEIRLSREDLSGLYNPYYAKLSGIFSIASLAASALLVLFILFAIIFNIKSVTYENLYYLAKDFDSVVSSSESTASTLIYSYEENRTYAAYKGGLVTAGRASMSIYSATGRKTATFYNGYVNPIIKASSKYILVYDVNGYEFSIYNSFARLYTETLSHPIMASAVCDDGSFLILTSDNEYKSVIYRYNSNFKRAASYYYSSYITAFALDSSGNYLISASALSNAGELAAKISLYEGSATEPFLKADGEGLVLMCGIKPESGLSSNVFYYYMSVSTIFVGDGGGTLHSVHLGAEKSIECLSSDDFGLTVAAKDSAGYVLYYLPYRDSSQNIRLDEKPLSVKKVGSIIYILYSDSVARYNITTGTYEKKSCAAGAEDIITATGGYVLVCYASRAVSIKF